MKKHTTQSQKGVTEIRLIMQVVTFLNNRGYIVWRHSNTGTFHPGEAKAALLKLYAALRSGQLTAEHYAKAIDTIFAMSWKKTPGVFPGIFDIVGFNMETGKLVIIEIKLGPDKLSPEQAEFMGKVKAAGGEAYVIRDLHLFTHNFMVKRGERLAEA